MKIMWIKPSGKEMETNDWPETIEYCESLDYKRKEKEEVKLEMPMDSDQPKKKRR